MNDSFECDIQINYAVNIFYKNENNEYYFPHRLLGIGRMFKDAKKNKKRRYLFDCPEKNKIIFVVHDRK